MNTRAAHFATVTPTATVPVAVTVIAICCVTATVAVAVAFTVTRIGTLAVIVLKTVTSPFLIQSLY